jgi:hypothetical protein
MKTVAEVKNELPDVKILWEGRTYWARVTGRLNRFAGVSPYQPVDGRKRVRIIMGPVFEFAWETVTNAVNKGTTLQA